MKGCAPHPKEELTLQNVAKTFCADCNRNQLIKIKQLAAFTPLNEDTFDEEVRGRDVARSRTREKQYGYSIYIYAYSILRVVHWRVGIRRPYNTNMVTKMGLRVCVAHDDHWMI